MKSNVDFTPYRLVPFERRWEEALIALITSCYGEYGQKIELDTLDNDLYRIEAIYGSDFRVLLHGDRLIGSVAVKRTGERAMDLKRLFVDPDYRRQGLGRRLSLWAYDFARDAGCTVLHVWSDVLYEGAHRLYRALGTNDTGRRRSLGGINSVEEFYFEWRIDQ